MKRRYYATHASFRCGSDYTMVFDAANDASAMRTLKRRLAAPSYWPAGQWILTTPVTDNHYGDTHTIGSAYKVEP